LVAYMWFIIAMSYGNEDAANAVKTLGSYLTFMDRRKAKRLAREWMKKHPK